MMLSHLVPCLHYNYNCTKKEKILSLYVKVGCFFVFFFFCFLSFKATAIIYFSYLRSATVVFTSEAELWKHSSISRMVSFGMNCYINVNGDWSVYNIKDMTIGRQIPDDQEAGLRAVQARKMEKPVWTMVCKPREEWGGKKKTSVWRSFESPIKLYHRVLWWFSGFLRIPIGRRELTQWTVFSSKRRDECEECWGRWCTAEQTTGVKALPHPSVCPCVCAWGCVCRAYQMSTDRKQ